MIGVDFGTTNTSVAYIAPGEYEARALRLAKANVPYNTLMPSVYINTPDEPLIGQIARQSMDAASHDSSVFASFKTVLSKPRLARDFAVTEYVRTSQYDFAEQSTLIVARQSHFRAFDRHTRTEYVEATAGIIRRALELASESEGRTVPEEGEPIVLGVPVHFPPRARRRLGDAVVTAGLVATHRELLERVRFVYEPVGLAATRVAYSPDPVTALIFDFGGGTLDLALLRVTLHPQYGVMLPDKLLGLGGRPWAGARLDSVVRELAKDWSGGARDKLDELEAAGASPLLAHFATESLQQLKHDLSWQETANRNVIDLPVTIHREAFDGAIAPLLAEIGDELDRVETVAGLTPGDIDTVVMGGGSSAVPAVQALLKARYPRAVDEGRFIHPTAGDDDRAIQSMEDAITGVATGLAVVGQLRALTDVFPFDYRLFNPRQKRWEQIAARGEPLDRPPAAVAIELFDGEPVGLYQDLVGDDLVIGIASPAPADGVTGDAEIRVTPGATATVPAVELRRGADWVSLFDPDDLSDEDLRWLFRFDLEESPTIPREHRGWLPAAPLRVGDHIRWRLNGMDEWGQVGSGVIRSIKRISTGEFVESTELFDVENYVLYVVDLRQRSGDAVSRLKPCLGEVRLTNEMDRGQ